MLESLLGSLLSSTPLCFWLKFCIAFSTCLALFSFCNWRSFSRILRTSWTGSHPATPISNRHRNETINGILDRFIFATQLQKNYASVAFIRPKPEFIFYLFEQCSLLNRSSTPRLGSLGKTTRFIQCTSNSNGSELPSTAKNSARKSGEGASRSRNKATGLVDRHRMRLHDCFSTRNANRYISSKQANAKEFKTNGSRL